jgi:hypothetical protein
MVLKRWKRKCFALRDDGALYDVSDDDFDDGGDEVPAAGRVHARLHDVVRIEAVIESRDEDGSIEMYGTLEITDTVNGGRTQQLFASSQADWQLWVDGFQRAEWPLTIVTVEQREIACQLDAARAEIIALEDAAHSQRGVLSDAQRKIATLEENLQAAGAVSAAREEQIPLEMLRLEGAFEGTVRVVEHLHVKQAKSGVELNAFFDSDSDDAGAAGGVPGGEEGGELSHARQRIVTLEETIGTIRLTSTAREEQLTVEMERLRVARANAERASLAGYFATDSDASDSNDGAHDDALAQQHAERSAILRAVEQEREELELQRIADDNHRAELTAALEVSQEKHTNARERSNEIELAFDAQNAQLAVLQRTLAEVKARAEGELAGAHADMQRLSADLAESRSETQANLADAAAQRAALVASERKKAHAETRRHEAKSSDADAALVVANEKVAALETELERLGVAHANIAELEAHVVARGEAAAAERARMQSALESAQSEIETQRAVDVSRRGELAAATDEVASARSSAAEMEVEFKRQRRSSVLALEASTAKVTELEAYVVANGETAAAERDAMHSALDAARMELAAQRSGSERQHAKCCATTLFRRARTPR